MNLALLQKLSDGEVGGFWNVLSEITSNRDKLLANLVPVKCHDGIRLRKLCFKQVEHAFLLFERQLQLSFVNFRASTKILDKKWRLHQVGIHDGHLYHKGIQFTIQFHDLKPVVVFFKHWLIVDDAFENCQHSSLLNLVKLGRDHGHQLSKNVLVMDCSLKVHGEGVCEVFKKTGLLDQSKFVNLL